MSNQTFPPEAIEAARRIMARTGNHSSEEFGYHTPTSDSAIVSRALLSAVEREECGADAAVSPTPETAAVVEALRWLTYVVNGVGKGGGQPEDGEEAAANKAAQEALTAYDAQGCPS